MTTSEEIPSVKTAVELEAGRRKRVFATFLALLIIPIAIGAYAIAKAPTETDVLVREATPIIEKSVEASVSQKVDQNIEPRVDRIVESRATPVIQKRLDQELDKAIVARVQPLEANYKILAMQDNTEHDKTEARIKQLEARIDALEQRLAAVTPPTRIQPALKPERVPLTHVPKPEPQ